MAIQYERQIVVQVAGLSITEPRIDFTITQTGQSDQNTGEITIYNLSRDRHAAIEERGERVVIQAGYKYAAGPQLVFDGVLHSELGKRENPPLS